MQRLFKTTKQLSARFCEPCSEVCDEGCRRAALRERTLLQQLWLGARV
jgi:hypothetical protein